MGRLAKQATNVCSVPHTSCRDLYLIRQFPPLRGKPLQAFRDQQRSDMPFPYGPVRTVSYQFIAESRKSVVMCPFSHRRSAFEGVTV